MLQKIVFWLYLVNTVLLILHEMDSAYWKEWELFRLPGGIGGFLLIHFPLYLVGLYGLVLVSQGTGAGMVLSIVVGAAGSLPFRLPLSPRDAIITGEIRHHDALTIDRLGCCAIALGHWASEQPVLARLAERLGDALPGVTFLVSAADRDPFRPI